MNRKALLLITVIVEGGLFLIGLLLMGGSGELLSRFGFSWGATGNALLLCIPMFAVLYLAMRSGWALLSRLRNDIDEKIAPIFADCRLFDLVVIAVLAGTGEELFFRGWLQSILIHRFEVWLGILITSAVFGLAHYLSTTYAIYAGLTGIYLGVIYQVSGNLFIVMAVHALYDLIALVYLVRKGKSVATIAPSG